VASSAVAPLLQIESCEDRVRDAFQEYISSNAENTSKGLVGNSPFWIGPVMDFRLRSCCATTLFNVCRRRTWSRSARAPMLHCCGSRRDSISVRVATCGVSLSAQSPLAGFIDASRLWSRGPVCVLQLVSSPEHECYRDRDRSPVHGLLCLPWTRSILDRRPAVRTTYARIHRLLRTRKVVRPVRPKQTSSTPRALSTSALSPSHLLTPITPQKSASVYKSSPPGRKTG
jgi:hypothetical protein